MPSTVHAGQERNSIAKDEVDSLAYARAITRKGGFQALMWLAFLRFSHFPSDECSHGPETNSLPLKPKALIRGGLGVASFRYGPPR